MKLWRQGRQRVRGRRLVMLRRRPSRRNARISFASKRRRFWPADPAAAEAPASRRERGVARGGGWWLGGGGAGGIVGVRGGMGRGTPTTCTASAGWAAAGWCAAPRRPSAPPFPRLSLRPSVPRSLPLSLPHALAQALILALPPPPPIPGPPANSRRPRPARPGARALMRAVPARVATSSVPRADTESGGAGGRGGGAGH